MTALFVNGYGATDNTDDRNYATYLSAVRNYAWTTLGDGRHTIYLCGGFTNRTDLTEAETMRRWFVKNPLPRNVEIVLVENTTDARGNICRVEALMESEEDIIIFCEYSRRRTMTFFARRLFRHFEVRGVPFDQQSLRLEQQAKQLLLHLPLEALAWYLPPFDALRKKLHARHMRRARSAKPAA
jgi:hypothetical protein